MGWGSRVCRLAFEAFRVSGFWFEVLRLAVEDLGFWGLRVAFRASGLGLKLI